LLVEDDAPLARPMVRLLARQGYDVTHVSTCEAALAQAASFDVAVLDMELPDGLGIDLYPELLGRGTVPVAIFFTSAPDASLLRRAARLARCVEKSQGVDALIAALAEVLASGERATRAVSGFAARDPLGDDPGGADAVATLPDAPRMRGRHRPR
jgi:DNA-binding response OmpR family regulator